MGTEPVEHEKALNLRTLSYMQKICIFCAENSAGYVKNLAQHTLCEISQFLNFQKSSYNYSKYIKIRYISPISVNMNIMH